MKQCLALLALLILAACAGPDFSGSRAPRDLSLAEAESAGRGVAIVGLEARAGGVDTMLQLDQVELTWQPLDPNGTPMILSAPGCAEPERAPTPCAGERMSYFVLTAPGGIYALDHLAVKLARGIRVRSFEGAERREIVLFAGAIAYLGDFTFDPQQDELVAYTRGDTGALAALRRYPYLRGPVSFVQPTAPGTPRATPQFIAP